MQISDKRLDEFIEIIKKENGVTLSREEARMHATRLLDLYELIYRPLPWEADPTIPIPDWVQTLPDDPAPEAP